MINDIQKTNINALQEAIEHITETIINDYFSVVKINENDLFNIVENVSQRLIDEKF